MKTIEQPAGIQAEFDAAVDFQEQPLLISGDVAVIEDLHKQAEQYVRTARVSRLSKPVAQVATMERETVLDGRRAVVAAKIYDMRNHSNMYDLLKQKRAEERDLAMARKLGLITTDRCAKHEKQLATVRGL